MVLCGYGQDRILCPEPYPPPPSPRTHTPSQGLEIRELKKSKPDKATIQPHIDALLSLKGEYKEKAGKDYAPPAAATSSSQPPNKAPKVASAAAAPATGGDSPAVAEIAAKIVAKVRAQSICS